MALPLESIASVAHEANRRYCQLVGDRVLPPWDQLDPQVRVGTTNGVRMMLTGTPVSPEESHAAWCREKVLAGWHPGDVTDDVAKTHKNLRAYSELPPEQKMKDHLFIAIVQTLLRDA